MTTPAPHTQRMTAEDLLRMPDDGYRYELVHGELRKMAPAGHKHGRIVINVTFSLVQHVRANNLGTVFAAETGFKLTSDPDTVRAPDVAFVRTEQVVAVEEEEGFWPGAPDLAVEVVSPNDTYADVEEKVLDWLNAGTQLVLIVNPRKRTVTAYRSHDDITVLTEDDIVDGGNVVPDWSLPVDDILV